MNQHKIWGNKRYHSLDYYLKQQYGRKLYKLSLNGGMTCPNRDGNIDTRGCIFCSSGGSGDFTPSTKFSITKQIEEAKKLVANKIKQPPLSAPEIPTEQYIAYFQAYTNTYADTDYLRSIYTEAINNPDIKILSIATRPDCLNHENLLLLSELNKIKPVWVELGLQTKHAKTAAFIRRGYPLSVFEEAIKLLREIGISIIVHVILGLPGESTSNMRETVNYVSTFPVQGIKLQLLHILKNTDLAKYDFPVLTMEEYIDLIISCIEILPQDIVIHRLTGDGPRDLLIAPLWSLNKKLVLNRINQELKTRDTWQGKYYIK